MGRTRRRQVEVEQTRAAIVEAAARTFAAAGFAESTMQDIATAAGYTTPTLYAYFEGKQAIIDALADMVEAEFTALTELPVPDGLTLDQNLELALHHQFAWCDRRREAFAALMSRPPNVASQRPIDGPGMSTRYYEKVLSQHAVEGRVGCLDVSCAAWFLWGITHAFFIRATRSPEACPLAPSARLVARLFLNGIRP